jgi:hypothetical protein
MSKFFGPLVAIAVVAGATASSAQSASEQFLFSKSGAGQDAAGCSTDPLGFSGDAAIKNAIRQLDLAGAAIEFVGCTTGEFRSSSPPGIDDSDLRFRIYYPVARDLRHADYIAPLSHELGHAFQIRQAGSMAALKRSLESRQIELGADYLVGLIAGRAGGIKLAQFQANVNLVGRYRESSDEHGTPVQRSYAFRYGFFFDKNHGGQTFDEAYAKFGDDFFTEIVDISAR